MTYLTKLYYNHDNLFLIIHFKMVSRKNSIFNLILKLASIAFHRYKFCRYALKNANF